MLTRLTLFQSTYLYKVRQSVDIRLMLMSMFQSTYLYKVRPKRRIMQARRRVSIHVPI